MTRCLFALLTAGVMAWSQPRFPISAGGILNYRTAAIVGTGTSLAIPQSAHNNGHAGLIVDCFTSAGAALPKATAPAAGQFIYTISSTAPYNVTVTFGTGGNSGGWCTVNGSGQGVAGANGANGSNGVINQIQQSGVNVTQRAILNMIGTGVTCVDNAGATRTDCTFVVPTHTHAAGDITSGTFADARIASTNVTQHQALLAIASTQLTGTLPDARVAASNVTQHQAALAIASTQLTGTILAGSMPAFSGDATSSAGSTALTLATVNGASGLCGDATHVCAVTTNAKGLVTAQSAVLISGVGGGGENPLTFSSPLTRNVNTISIPVATNAANGYLSSGDWVNFNAKEAALTFSAPLSRAANSISVLTGTTAGTVALGNHVHATADITSGTFADARIASSNVTQHQALFAIAATQLTGTIAAARMPAFTGDATSSAGSTAITLATVNGAPATCGSATQVCQVVTNAKGLVTSQTPVTITGGGGAPTTSTYITQTADAGLSAEQALSSLATGPVKVTTGTGVLSSGAINLATEITGTLPATSLPAHTGDATSSAGSAALTLATVNGAPGTCGSATQVCQVVTNGKGLVTGQTPVTITGGGGGAPTTSTYITQTADAGLSAEQALSSLATGPVKVTTGTGVLSSGAINLATEITGTLPAASLPNPTLSTLGGVRSITCSGTDKLSAIGLTGIPACTADSGAGSSGATTQVELTDLKVTTNGSTTISVPPGIMPRFGQTICPDYTGGNVVMSSGTATVYISVANDCTVQATSTALFGTPTNMTTGVGSAFPVNHMPLAHCSYPTIVCTDDRRAFSTLPLLAGANISVTSSSAGYTIASTGGGGGGSSVTAVPSTQSFNTASWDGTTTILASGWGIEVGDGANDPSLAVVDSGSHHTYGIQLDNGDTKEAVFATQIPSAWNGSAMSLSAFISVGIVAAGTGTIQVYYACLANNVDTTVGFNAATFLSGSLGNGTSARTHKLTASQTLTGCAAGNELHLAFFRDTADTFTASLIITNVSFTWNLTLQ